MVRFYAEFNGAVVCRNGLTHIATQIVKVAQEHPSLLKIRQKFYRTLVSDHRHLLAVQLHHGIAQVEPGKGFIAAFINGRTVQRHRFLKLSLVIQLIRFEEIIFSGKQRERQQ